MTLRVSFAIVPNLATYYSLHFSPVMWMVLGGRVIPSLINGDMPTMQTMIRIKAKRIPALRTL